MMGIKKVISEAEKNLGVSIPIVREDKNSSIQFDETNQNTPFRFFFRGKSYYAEIVGKGKEQENYAMLLPAYIESFSLSGGDISKEEYLKKILLEECPSSEIYKFILKYSIKDVPCYVIALKLPNTSEEVLSLISQYGGNPADTAIRFDDTHCALIKFFGEEEDEYHSSSDYADFLAESLKEELGISVTAGIGSSVKSFKDIAISYAQAASTLRYADVFSDGVGIHSYKEYMLVRMIEDISDARLSEYFEELTDENAKEIFNDTEMLETAEEFLLNSLNVSETSRKLYMHRNTLLYRLDKIEKATGLNLRDFPDAVSFRVLTILYRLQKK